MGKRKTILYLATVVLLVFVVCLCFAQRERSGFPFSVWVSAGEKTESISLWESDTGECYVFLPAYAKLEQVRIHLHTGNPVSLDGVQLEEGMLCDVFQPESSYTLFYSTWGMTKQKTVTFLQSASVAAMHIDTQSGSMEFIHEKKGNEETGAMRLYTHEGVLDYDGELESINGRGNNTWESFEKKPYSISLKEEKDLLDMGYAKKWILLADADDLSNMRNKIVYDFAEEFGLAYSPDSQWVDLYLNGEYAGLYLLCERNELHSERVNISQNGSFLVSLEKWDRLIVQNYSYIMTDAQQTMRIHYPKQADAAYLEQLKDVWQAVENAILAEDGIDPNTGKHWLDLIDLDSWAMKYLIEEVFASGDACFISQYFYLDGNNPEAGIYAGPVWDFDHSLGTRVAWALMPPNVLYANRLHVKDGFDAPWFYELYQKEIFYNRVVQLYEQKVLPLLEQYISKRIPDYANQISKAHKMNQVRWLVDSLGIDAEKNEICTYISERKAFLEEVWINGKSYNLVKVDQGFGAFYGYFVIWKDQKMHALPELENTPWQTFCGWYYKDTDEPFDPDRPITEDIEIYAKWQDNASKKTDQLLKLVPLGVIAVMGVGLVWVEVKRWKRRR